MLWWVIITKITKNDRQNYKNKTHIVIKWNHPLSDTNCMSISALALFFKSFNQSVLCPMAQFWYHWYRSTMNERKSTRGEREKNRFITALWMNTQKAERQLLLSPQCLWNNMHTVTRKKQTNMPAITLSSISKIHLTNSSQLHNGLSYKGVSWKLFSDVHHKKGSLW